MFQYNHKQKSEDSSNLLTQFLIIMSELSSNFITQAGFILIKSFTSGSTALFLVKNPLDSKQYIIKSLYSDTKTLSVTQEKDIHASLSHPNIITYIPNDHIFHSHQINRHNLITMEYAPYGDFFDLILDYPVSGEKLIRTYFHQLIKGLKYLHSQQIAHLDLKLENLLLSEEFSLKIADFDLAKDMSTTSTLLSRGTANYRAPEVLYNSYDNFCAADVYSAGICLYVLMTGAFPFMEETEEQEVKLFRYDTFLDDNTMFWAENQEIVEDKIYLSQTFKELVNGMWVKDPMDRISLEEIEKSRWYNEPIYGEEDLKIKMKEILRHE